MCGVSARTTRSSSRPLECPGRARGPRARSSRRRWQQPRPARRNPVGRSSARTSSSPPRPCKPRGEPAVRVIRVDRLGLLRAHRPAVEAGGHAHDRDARGLVAGHDRPLDRGRAAPARQQRRVDVQHRVVREQRLLDQRAERAHADGFGLCGRDPLAGRLVVDVLRLIELDPELAGGVGDRRRRQLAPAAARPVRSGEHELRPVGRSPRAGAGSPRRTRMCRGTRSASRRRLA